MESILDTSPPVAADGRVVLDRYRLDRRLGSGGFGVVWLAHDLKLDREVAVKRIPTEDAAVAERARREGLAAARLSHPGIVALYETAADEDALYLVSELVRGRTLAQRSADGELSDRDVLEIGVVLCDALDHAHSRGVVHRDVKPPNVIVPDRRGGAEVAAKLTDFGIARLAGDDAVTRTGDVVGTLAYMAPEQAEGRDVGPEADLYALGLCLYEALAGVNPVRARGATATVRRIGRRLPPLGRLRRDLPLDLCEAIDAAVWPHPQERGRLKDLRAALAQAGDRVGDEPGTVEGSPLEPLAPVAPPVRTPVADRALSCAGAAGLVAAALAVPDAAAPLPVWQGAVAAALAVALLPRAGWLLAVTALCWWLLAAEPLLGGLLAAAALPVAVLLRHASPALWSLPAVAPALGAVGAAGAYPALTAHVRRIEDRAAAGALGGLWVVLGERVADEPLLLGGAPREGVGDVLWWAVSSGALGIAGVWAVAAMLLPLLVRGRRLGLDLVGASAWAAGTAAATQAVAGALSWPGGPPEPRGMAVAAVASGVLAVVLRRHAAGLSPIGPRRAGGSADPT